MKTYYQILGVLDDAEDVVIRAAYKALAQKYHPDKWVGSKEEANSKMAMINEAYETLIDSLKRSEYDKTINKNEYEQDAVDEDDLVRNIDGEWRQVIEFLPSVDQVARDLARLSKTLEYAYKLILLENKQFNSCVAIASQLENGFLRKYFGLNPKIHTFAKALLYNGRREDAKRLNNAVVLLGSDVDPLVIIRKIDPAYETKYHWSQWKGETKHTANPSGYAANGKGKKRVFIWDSSVFNPVGKVVIILIALLLLFGVISAIVNEPRRTVNAVPSEVSVVRSEPIGKFRIVSDGNKYRWKSDKECFVLLSKNEDVPKLQLTTEQTYITRWKDLTVENRLVAVLYYTPDVTEQFLTSFLTQDNFNVIRSMCERN